MDIEEVVDRESLEAYLDELPEEERLFTARRVAFRAAVRVAPLAFAALSDPVRPFSNEIRGRTTAVAVFGAIAFSRLANDKLETQIDSIARSGAFSSAIFSSSTVVANNGAFGASNASAIAANTISENASSSASAAVANAEYTGAFNVWELVQMDLHRAIPDYEFWLNRVEPLKIRDAWEVAKAQLVTKEKDDWSFWIAWFDRVRAGRETHAAKMINILNPLREEDWDKGPAHINPMFDELLEIYRAEDAALLFGDGPSDLAQSFVVDFTFDDVRKVMKLLGITDDNSHLRDPAFLQGFLDDAEEARDLLRDFADDAAALSGGNYAGVMQRKAEKVLAEFDRVADQTHLRARYLVTLAGKLERHSKDAKCREDLGETLVADLGDAMTQLKTLCRKHFGPAYAALAPLSELAPETLDQVEVVALFEQVIARLETPAPEMVALDHEAMQLFRGMLDDLKYSKSVLAEANSDEFTAIMQGKFAEEAAEFGVTVNRLVKQSVRLGGATLNNAEKLIETGERVKKVSDVLSVLRPFVLGA